MTTNAWPPFEHYDTSAIFSTYRVVETSPVLESGNLALGLDGRDGSHAGSGELS